MLPPARSHHARIIAIAPPNRHGRRGAGRGECLLGVANVAACVGMKKRAGFLFPRPLAPVLSLVDALVVVVHEALLANDVAIRSAWMDVRCFVARPEIMSHTEADFSALNI